MPKSNWSLYFDRCSNITRPITSQSALCDRFDISTHHIVGHYRLDNRQALQRELRYEPDISDRQLILAAYKKWGAACVERFVGAFAFALWDATRQHLFCACDHFEFFSLFYYCDAKQFVCASDVRRLLAHEAVDPRPNLPQIAAATLSAGLTLNSGETYYKDIHLLPGATYLIVRADTLQRQRYWQPDPTHRLTIPSRETPDALRALLYEATAARLPADQPVGALLSGGLDSSAVVAIAADILRQQNRQLLTFSSVMSPDAPRGTVDERAYIDQFRQWDNINLHYVTAEGRGPFDAVDALVQTCDQALFTSRHYLYSALTATAQAHGVTHMLDGSGGELGPTDHAKAFYTDQLLRGRWGTLWRELPLRAQRDDQLLRATLKNRLFKPLLPNRLLKLLGFKGETHGFAQIPIGQILQPSFISAQLGDTIGQLETTVADFQKQSLWLRTNQRREIDFWSQNPMGAAQRFIGYESIQFSYPLMDKRVVEFCLAARAEWKVHNGYTRHLVRSALDGLLPPEIQWRTSKQPFSPDYAYRYNRQQPWVQQFLATIMINDPIRAIVNVERLKQLAQIQMLDSAGRTSADKAALAIVPFGIYLISFLRQFPDFQK